MCILQNLGGSMSKLLKNGIHNFEIIMGVRGKIVEQVRKKRVEVGVSYQMVFTAIRSFNWQ
jgi:hypothetical protein